MACFSWVKLLTVLTLWGPLGNPTSISSTKFGDFPNPKTMYGSWREKYPELVIWPAKEKCCETLRRLKSLEKILL